MLGTVSLILAAPLPAAAKSSRKKEATMTRLVSYLSDAAKEVVVVEVLLRGKGPLVVLLPSLGRGATDFDDLSARIAAAGFRAAAINPRGIGKSKGPTARSLADYARDVFEVITALQTGRGQVQVKPVVLIGHAYGNRLARAVASRYPEVVTSLILLASGGQVAMAPNVGKALFDVFDPSLSPDAHIAAVQTAFFAPGNDPQIWNGGWFGTVAMQQQLALKNSPDETWSDGGSAPIYIIQAAQDLVAPPANAEALQAAHPDRVEIAILENAGHAILPEQPEQLGRLVLGRLTSPGNRAR
jgi:pimeloyl-ACP methyl ester carboxylesterase